MSAEAIVKKRGRPKKILSDPIEVELKLPEIKSATNRAKSTKATPRPTKAKAPTSAKSPVVEKPTSKPVEAKKPVPKPIEVSTPSTKLSSSPSRLESHPEPTKSPVTPETSKILQQVREISAKSAAPQLASSNTADPSSITPLKAGKASKPPAVTQSKYTPTTQTSKTTSTISAAKSSIPPQSKPPSSSTASKPSPQVSKPTSSLPHPSDSMPKPKPHIPIAALNSAVVSNISERAGARPNTARSKALPQSYNTVARKITLAIVAMPIAIVTSYVLYQRLVLGDDRKLLVVPGMAKVESPPTESSKNEGSKNVET